MALYTIVAEIVFDMGPTYLSIVGDTIVGKSIYGYYVGDLITTGLSAEALLCAFLYWHTFRANRTSAIVRQ